MILNQIDLIVLMSSTYIAKLPLQNVYQYKSPSRVAEDHSIHANA